MGASMDSDTVNLTRDDIIRAALTAINDYCSQSDSSGLLLSQFEVHYIVGGILQNLGLDREGTSGM